MREILFRGKRVDTEEWVYGMLCRYHEDVFAKIVPNDFGPHEDKMAHCVRPDTVGQYTGLTDRNGVKIFEGDVFVLPGNDKCKYAVAWDEAGGFTIFTDEIGFSPEHVEIIGNIHDNPGLLGVKK